jgi:hypothetical protein
MQRLTGAERQKRIELARDVALRLVRRQHNIEIDGELQRVWEFRHNSAAIVYLCPRSGSSNPHRLTIRERGKIVFSLEWLDGEQLRRQLSTERMGARDARVSKNAQRNARVTPKAPAGSG